MEDDEMTMQISYKERNENLNGFADAATATPYALLLLRQFGILAKQISAVFLRSVVPIYVGISKSDNELAMCALTMTVDSNKASSILIYTRTLQVNNVLELSQNRACVR